MIVERVNFSTKTLQFFTLNDKIYTIMAGEKMIDNNTTPNIDELVRELEELEAKLKTPERTLDDLIRHIELLKELNN